MNKIILIAFFISGSLFAKSNLYQISFSTFVDHNEFSAQKAMKHQIVHSMGTGMNRFANRSSLNYNYEIKVTETVTFEKFQRTYYSFRGEFLIENELDQIENYKIILPLNPETIFDSASRFKHYCSKSGYRGNKETFYWAWSPNTKYCGLKVNEHFLEVEINSATKVVQDSLHLSSEFLVDDEYALFYYFGSDFFSLRNFGMAQKGYTEISRTLRRLGFSKIKYSNMLMEIIGTNSLYSQFLHYQGEIHGKKANAYIMLGNPTDHTPGAKKEFFKFTKYALENGSTYTYMGHAGLGSVFNLDLQEQQFGEKINYNLNQKQMIYIDGCNTFFYSTNFFFKKKPLTNSLVLITNGLSILTNFYKQTVSTILDNLLLDQFTNEDLESKAEYYMRNQRARLDEMALVNASSN